MPAKRKVPAKGAAALKKKARKAEDLPADNEDFFLASDDEKKKGGDADEEPQDAVETVEEKRLRLGTTMHNRSPRRGRFIYPIPISPMM